MDIVTSEQRSKNMAVIRLRIQNRRFIPEKF